MLLAELLVKLTGDDAKLKTSFSSAGTTVSKFEGIAKKSGMAVAAIFKVMAVATVAAVTYSIAAYSKQETAVNDLTATLKTLKGTSAATTLEFEKAASALQRKSRFGDEDILVGMKELVQITGDYKGSLKASSIVVDLAAAKNMDLKNAALLVGRAYTGQTEMLRRYGIVLKEGAKGQEVLTELNAKFHGSAEQQINTLGGRTKYLGNIFGDYAEVIGNKVGPVIFNFVQERLIPMFNWFGKLINKLSIFNIKLNSIAVSELNVKIREQEALVQRLTDKWTKQGETMGFNSDSTRYFAEEQQNAIKELKNLKEQLDIQIAKEKEWKENMDNGVVPSIQNTSKEVNAWAAQVQGAGNIIGNAMANTVTALLDANATMAEKMSAILKGVLNAVLDAIAMQISAYIALETTKAISTGGLTAPTIAAAVAQLAIIQGLKAAVSTISFEGIGLAKGGVKMRRGFVDFAEEGPEAALPLKTIEPLIGAAIEKYVTNKNSLQVIINAKTIDNNTDFDRVARNIDRSLNKLDKRRGKI